MGRNRKLVKNATFVMIGSLGAKLMGFIMLPLYTSWLSPEAYGTADIISTYAMLLLNVVAFDVSDAIFVFPIGASFADQKKYYSTGFLFQIVCSVAAAFIFWGLSCLPLENILCSHTWLIYGILISRLFQKYTQDFCRGIDKMSVFSYSGIVNAFAMALFAVLLIPKFKVIGFVIAQIIANIITMVFTFFYSASYKYCSVNNFSYPALKEMLNYSVPLIPTAVMWWLVSGLNRPLLEEYTGLLAVGFFAVAAKLPSLQTMIYGFFQQAWMVTVIEEFKKKDFADYYNRVFRVVFSVQVLACMLVVVFAKPFIRLMTSPDYYDSWQYVPLIAYASVLSNISAFTGTVFSAAKKTKYTFYSTIIGGFSSIILNIIFIPMLGLWGACVSFILTYFACAISRIMYSVRFVPFRNASYVFWQSILIMVCYFGSFFESLVLTIVAQTLVFVVYLYLNKDAVKQAKSFVRK